ncbi:hypothetical protein [Alicyclobacillus fastidiosus]|uniref:Uncharacterized protein n=1 Tax=Alicyclobacillus fastidiosus TaxID=392011 RepID=A0ABV5A8Q7_9BACL|nr:hypothetical protein [Alicyclobacillus fastidiosus]WEH10633.1 hypothetical protein PYS47_05255 [Alicyclobacillus fastidiosus]
MKKTTLGALFIVLALSLIALTGTPTPSDIPDPGVGITAALTHLSTDVDAIP